MKRLFRGTALLLSMACATPLLAQLTVTSLSPTRNVITAPVTSSISVGFDRDVDAASVTDQSFWVIGRWSGLAVGSLSVSGNTITFTPTTSFSKGELVSIVMSEGIHGSDASSLQAGGFSYQFWIATSPSARTFTLLQDFSTSSFPGESTVPYGAVGSDFNNDDYLDFGTVNEVTGDFRVYLNNADGSGTFGPMVEPVSELDIQASPNEPSDFNHDGNIDFCSANGATSSVTVLLGSGDGTFYGHQEITVPPSPHGIAVLDYDGDGDVDIVVGSQTTNRITLLTNNGSGAFSTAGEIVLPYDVYGLTACDMDEDGRPDIVLGSRDSQRVLVLRGTGAADFATTADVFCGGSSWVVTCGDLNGDGHIDVTSSNSYSDNSSIIFGDGAGGLGAATIYSTDSFPLSTDVGDVDGDGDLDWMLSCYSGDWQLYVNDGTGSFSLDQEMPPYSSASCAVLFDIDNDGDLDCGFIDENSSHVFIYSQVGSPPAPEFIRSDCDGDGATGISDAIQALSALFLGAPMTCVDACDSNDDGTLNIADPLWLLTYLFSFGDPPPAPFPACGEDPTDDGLDCAIGC